jgi:dTDP-4-amino-4,6-dideoxygalactose transaminase
MAIPLSYTPIDHAGLAEVLTRHESVPHVDLITEFERCLAAYAPGRFPVAVQSGTSAIHLALKALGVCRGDYVIVPSFTYIGSVNPVLYEGATPVFVDCEPDTWNIDPNLLHTAITELIRLNRRPKAIIIVHTYGMPCDMNSIRQISSEFEIPVLEDAAEAVGSTIDGMPAGCHGEISVLSFNNNKTLTTYGGGVVLCSSSSSAKKVLFWATQSREPRPYYLHEEVGYNYRMSPIAAAMGIAAWPTLSDRVNRRIEILEYYRVKLIPAGWRGQAEKFGKTNAWLSVFAFPESATIQQVRKVYDLLAEKSIEVRPFWNPLHLHPLFTGCKFFGGNIAQNLFARGICLPSSNQLSQQDLDTVISTLHTV